MKKFKIFKQKIKSIRGNSLAEFAVTTAMMATLATTAAPRFSGIGEGAKEKKTMAEIDKIVTSASNFFNDKVTVEGRGRFPGQEKYTVPIGGYIKESSLLSVIGEEADDQTAFDEYSHPEGAQWRSVFGFRGSNIPTDGSQVIEDNEGNIKGHEEFLDGFANNPIPSGYQDGHFIYVVIPGGTEYVNIDGNEIEVECNTCSPILYVADLENPAKLFKKYQP